MFLLPATCSEESMMLYLAQMKYRHLNKCITKGLELVLLLTMTTTAALSHTARTWFFAISWPHFVQAITIGSSSFTLMCTSAQERERQRDHGSENHSFPKYAPQPQEPDASETTFTSMGHLQRADRIDTPFHDSIKVAHHCRSARKSTFSHK